jgi:hypothetical protein
MRVRYTIAVSLIAVVTMQAGSFAQAPTSSEPASHDAAVVTIGHDEAIRVFMSNLTVRSQLRLELADGSFVQGTVVEVQSRTMLALQDGRLRREVPIAAIVGARPVIRTGASASKAFGVGAAIGAAVGVVAGLTVGRMD